MTGHADGERVHRPVIKRVKSCRVDAAMKLSPRTRGEIATALQAQADAAGIMAEDDALNAIVVVLRDHANEIFDLAAEIRRLDRLRKQGETFLIRSVAKADWLDAIDRLQVLEVRKAQSILAECQKIAALRAPAEGQLQLGPQWLVGTVAA